MKVVLTSLAAVLILGASTINAGVPNVINYQGRLTDATGVPVADGSFSVVFTIYDAATAGTSVWTETQNVNTSGGLFAVLLGSVSPVLDTVFNGTTRYLGISIASNPELTPRTAMVSVPYAQRVSTVDGASGGNITSKVSIGPGVTNSGLNAFVVGESNSASGDNSTVGGGKEDTASGWFATVSGGAGVTASGFASTVGGGQFNKATGIWSTVAGGREGKAIGDRSTVGGGYINHSNNFSSTVSGGQNNTSSGDFATVGGGFQNNADSIHSTIGGGILNRTSDTAATVSGGQSNTATGMWSTVGGGKSNFASGNNSTVGGGITNIASGFKSTVGGGEENTASGNSSTISGGFLNSASDQFTTVGGGIANFATGLQSTVSGGQSNTANNLFTTVGGGFTNLASGQRATVGGGESDTASGGFSTVSGGLINSASGANSTVGGGQQNVASGSYSTSPGGLRNEASGFSSFAAGRSAKATHTGSFVWADNTGADFTSNGANSFAVRASGGVILMTNSSLTTGVLLNAGSGTWLSASDRNIKDNFETVDPQLVLDKVAAMPMTTWNYKSQDESIRHMGVMAQDLYESFGLGTDDKHIATIDADGIALAAIKGLYQKLNQKLEQKDVEIEELRNQLEQLKTLVETALVDKVNYNEESIGEKTDE